MKDDMADAWVGIMPMGDGKYSIVNLHVSEAIEQDPHSHYNSKEGKLRRTFSNEIMAAVKLAKNEEEKMEIISKFMIANNYVSNT